MTSQEALQYQLPIGMILQVNALPSQVVDSCVCKYIYIYIYTHTLVHLYNMYIYNIYVSLCIHAL